MNLLTRLYPGDAFSVLALSVIVQIAVISLLAVIAARALARRNAALRHCILLSALLWIPFSPLAAWRISRVGLFKIDITQGTPRAAEFAKADESLSGVTPAVEGPVLVANHHVESAAPIQPIAPPLETPARRVNVIPLVVSAALIVWILGTVFQLLRLIHALRHVSVIRRSSRTGPASVETALDEACDSLSLSRRPAALISDSIPGPVTIGCLHAAIVLPVGLLEDISPAQLREILIHEAVHAWRCDYATGILQRLIAAVLWFHPMVHLLNRELSRAREEVCDNAVLRAGRATDYARTLLDLSQRIRAQFTPRLVPGLFDGSWRLENRIAGILNRRRVIMTSVRLSSRLTVASLVLSAGLALSAVSATRAQSRAEDRTDPTQVRPAAPATGPGAPAATTSASGDSAGQWLDRGPDFVSPDEEAVRAKVEQGQLAVSKASLALKEAQIKLRKEKIDLDRKQALRENKTISVGEVEEAKLSVELAEVQVQRAEVDLAEAKSAAVPTRIIGLTVHDGQRSESDRYNEHVNETIQTFLARHFKNALDGGWNVTLLRRGNGSQVVVKHFGALSQKFAPQVQNLQAGDYVVVRRDIVRVLKDSQVIWQTQLNGRKMTLPEALAEAGINYKTGDPDLHVSLMGTRPGRYNDLNWSAQLSNIASGFGKNEILEPSDVIVLNRH